MELKRKPFQGVFNIIRFNWHFYLAAGLVLISLILFKEQLPGTIQPFIFWFALLAAMTIALSLIVSFYIYDISDLYQLNWLSIVNKQKVLNINAGFDETSAIIKSKYPDVSLTICDFYDPEKHTEISIKRARKAYPTSENTILLTSDTFPFQENSFDCSLAIFSAHEIRNEAERIDFFKELKRVTKPGGQVGVTEHLRNLNNFLVYTMGCLHFHSKASWLRTFKEAGLTVKEEIKTTPFITTFILEKNGEPFKIIGVLLIGLALVHIVFPKYFNWREELKQLSLINRQMMTIHTLFIALMVFLMGLLCLTSATELTGTNLGKTISLGLGIFWVLRLFIQFFGYSTKLWNGKKLETTIHIMLSGLWTYFSVIFWKNYLS